MVYCGDCGAQNEDGKRFCWKCGKSLHFEGESPHSAQNVLDLPTKDQENIPAPSGQRLLAFMIDGATMWIIAFLLILSAPDKQFSAVGIPVLYFTLSWGLAGTSIGKWSMGLYLVNMNGKSIGLGRAFVRCFFMILLAPLWFTWWSVPFRKDRRALHDLIAGTVLIKRRVTQSQTAKALTGLTVLTIGLGLLVMIENATVYRSLVGILWGGNALQTSQPQIAEIPTLQPISSITELQPTSTRQPIIIPLATPTRQITITPLATPTSIWLFADDFVDNSSLWPISETNAYFENNSYHVKSTTEGYSYWTSCNLGCRPFIDYTDFAYEATIAKVEGPDDYGYGLMFRSPKLDSFYAFQVFGNGAYLFDKLESDQWRTITKWTPTNAVNKGNSKNKLRVVCIGSYFQFYVNDQFVGSAMDTTYPSGGIGLGVSSVGMHIRVEYVRVWRVATTPSAEPTERDPLQEFYSTPTPDRPIIPSGMGGFIVVNYYGQAMTVTIADKRYDVSANGRVVIFLEPGTYSYSANWEEHSYYHGTVEIKLGRYYIQSFAD